jgi:hypothetical protein
MRHLKLLINNSKLYFTFCYIFLIGIFSFHYLVSAQAVYGDGIGHYAYLHSWYFDADNDFTNEYQHLYSYENNNSLSPKKSQTVQIVATNSQGKALNHFSPGMAILLMPFYVLADAVVVIANALGASLARNGYSNVYQIVSGIGAIFYVVLALWLSEKFLKLFKIPPLPSRVAILTLLLSTNLLYYGSFDILNSHFASFFLSILFFWYFFKHRLNLTLQKYFLLGVIASLMTATRPQDGIIIAVVLANAFLSAKSSQISWSKLFTKLLVFFLPLTVTIIFLTTQWIETFDSFSSHPYFYWMIDENSPGILFNSVGNLLHFTNGLFTRTPIIFLGSLMFLYLIYKKKQGYFLNLLALFFCLQYVLISLQGGWKAAAYGGRMYISSLPFFLVLIAKLFEFIKKKYSNKTKWILISFLISLNILSIFSFVLLEKEASGNRRGTETYTYSRIMKAVDGLGTGKK